MTRRLRAIIAPVLTGVALLAGLTVGPTPASAGTGDEPTCHGWGCDHRDPYTTNCYIDGHVVSTAYLTQATVIRMWYSVACQSAWTEYGPGYDIKVVSYDSAGRYRATEQTHTQLYVQHSRMLYDGYPYVAEACLGLPATGGAWLCTPRY